MLPEGRRVPCCKKHAEENNDGQPNGDWEANIDKCEGCLFVDNLTLRWGSAREVCGREGDRWCCWWGDWCCCGAGLCCSWWSCVIKDWQQCTNRHKTSKVWQIGSSGRAKTFDVECVGCDQVTKPRLPLWLVVTHWLQSHTLAALIAREKYIWIHHRQLKTHIISLHLFNQLEVDNTRG